MNRKEFIEAAKFTVEKGQGIYFFIGILANKALGKRFDQEFEDLFQEMVKNDED